MTVLFGTYLLAAETIMLVIKDDRLFDQRQSEVTAEQLAQRRIIQQELRRTDNCAPRDDSGKPVQAALQHRKSIRAIDGVPDDELDARLPSWARQVAAGITMPPKAAKAGSTI